jgi:outer membrane protein OmpA-like peptidoglycan-associated protein
MKPYIPYALLLAGVLMLPAMAQLTPDDSQQPAASSQSKSQSTSDQTSNADQSSQSSSAQNTESDQNLSAQQPLDPKIRQGFWGKLNPFARKKYVQNQLAPVRNRVTELDDLSAANAKDIKDVDARTQAGIRQADQHAVDAGNRAQQANQTALQASNGLNTVEQVVGNIDQYHPAAQTEIRFRSGQTALSAKDKAAIDDMATGLKDQKGYVIEVQGFSPAGVQSSQAMANSVVRYLVEKHEVPVYRIFVIGMGNTKLPATEDNTGKTAHGNRVEISLLKNNVDQLSSMNQPAARDDSGVAKSGNSGKYSTSKQYAATQQSPSDTKTSNMLPPQ